MARFLPNHLATELVGYLSTEKCFGFGHLNLLQSWGLTSTGNRVHCSGDTKPRITQEQRNYYRNAITIATQLLSQRNQSQRDLLHSNSKERFATDKAITIAMSFWLQYALLLRSGELYSTKIVVSNSIHSNKHSLTSSAQPTTGTVSRRPFFPSA